MAAKFGNASEPLTTEAVLEKEQIKKDKKAKQRATRKSLGPGFRPLEPEESEALEKMQAPKWGY